MKINPIYNKILNNELNLAIHHLSSTEKKTTTVATNTLNALPSTSEKTLDKKNISVSFFTKLTHIIWCFFSSNHIKELEDIQLILEADTTEDDDNDVFFDAAENFPSTSDNFPVENLSKQNTIIYRKDLSKEEMQPIRETFAILGDTSKSLALYMKSLTKNQEIIEKLDLHPFYFLEILLSDTELKPLLKNLLNDTGVLSLRRSQAVPLFKEESLANFVKKQKSTPLTLSDLDAFCKKTGIPENILKERFEIALNDSNEDTWGQVLELILTEAKK